MSTAPDRRSSGLRGGRPMELRPGGPWHEALPYASPRGAGGRLAGPVERRGGGRRPGDGRAGRRGRASGCATELGADRRRRGVPAARRACTPSPGSPRRCAGPAAVGRVTTADGRALIVGQQLLDLPGRGPSYWTRLCLGVEVAGGRAAVDRALPLPRRPRRGGTGSARRTRVLDAAATAVRTPTPTTGRRSEVLRELPRRPGRSSGRPAPSWPSGPPISAGCAISRPSSPSAAASAPDRIADAVLAVNELASNSVEHGPGRGRLRLWTDGDAGWSPRWPTGGGWPTRSPAWCARPPPDRAAAGCGWPPSCAT